MNKASPGPSQLNLVNSKRLQALRKQTSTIEEHTATGKQPDASLNQATAEDAETRRLRLFVRQCLADILAQLPAGKQNSLFKIRFGMSMHEFEQLSPHQAAEVLKIERRRIKK
jgi:hypothetical protein